jgi:hypothetical protein
MQVQKASDTTGLSFRFSLSWITRFFLQEISAMLKRIFLDVKAGYAGIEPSFAEHSASGRFDANAIRCHNVHRQLLSLLNLEYNYGY